MATATNLSDVYVKTFGGEGLTPVPSPHDLRLKGRVIRLKLKTPAIAADVHAALSHDGVVEVLEVLGKINALAPAERRLAITLLGEP